MALVASTASSTAFFFLARVVGAFVWMRIREILSGKGEKVNEHRSIKGGISFSFFVRSIASKKGGPFFLFLLTFAAAAFFAAADVVLFVVVDEGVLVANVRAPESRSRASERRPAADEVMTFFVSFALNFRNRKKK